MPNERVVSLADRYPDLIPVTSVRDLDGRSDRYVAGHELLFRMLEEPAYDDPLFVEISALTFSNDLMELLRDLLERPDLHGRFVNRSDYPVAGIRFLDGTSRLVSEGFLTEADAEPLREIYSYTPLLFDFWLKRRIRHPPTGVSLPAAVLMLPPALERHLAAQ